ncbi:putative GTPase activating protein [Trypanosoma grayi]|uniref:putative GTPase activating protein n=1 Tax=Trypanosoma grayi TaxID=71804 RepID=UPI0004F4382B|nr:putative GTPase activating protein [Trypanosoma grayi]KEG13872.1 putative GTPase activating protein [Trypanosoma grayi]
MSRAGYLAEQPQQLDDFVALTGLKVAYATECFGRFGGYAPALASFAQSYPLLPKSYFDRRDAVRLNMLKINEELKLIYKRAREIKAQSGKNVKEVWASYYIDAEPIRVAPPPDEHVPSTKKLQYCEPSHFTGPFFDMPLFWKEEGDCQCPLLNFDKRSLECKRYALRKRLELWVNRASAYRRPVHYVDIGKDEEDETVRVIIKDADRTFFHPEHRKKFVAFLNAMYHEFKVYTQAMGYLAGLCLLALNEEETAAVLRFVSCVHLPPQWAMEAVGFVTAARVIESLVKPTSSRCKSTDPEVGASMYKYFQSVLNFLCGNTVNVEEIFGFFELLMGDIRSLSIVGDSEKAVF